jgi:hypothetical protein
MMLDNGSLNILFIRLMIIVKYMKIFLYDRAQRFVKKKEFQILNHS